jgi:hypothetical protein
LPPEWEGLAALLLLVAGDFVVLAEIDSAKDSWKQVRLE